jgi:hypothetical protein
VECHTSEGFSDIDASNPSPIGCFTCHTPHTTFDFSLRKNAIVSLEVGGIDFDIGKANLCANCHQVRTPDPDLEEFPTTPGSSDWGPHYVPMSNMLVGAGADELGDGSYSTLALHGSAPDGCVNCHMAIPGEESGGAGKAGGHTWKMKYEYNGTRDNVAGCNVAVCHGLDPLPDFDKGNVQTNVRGMIEELGELLIGLGLLDPSLQVFPDRTYSREEIGIVFNFLLLQSDRSMGVHNPLYITGVAERTLTHAQAFLPD